MATSPMVIPKDEWTLVSTISVSFQTTDKNETYAVEALALPTDKPYGKVIIPRKEYRFTKLDGNLYMYSVGKPLNISIDPVA